MTKHRIRGLRSLYPKRKVAFGFLLKRLNATEENADARAVREIVRVMNEIDRIMGFKGYFTIPVKRVRSAIEERARRDASKAVTVLMTKLQMLYRRFPIRLEPGLPRTHEWRFGLGKNKLTYAPELLCVLVIRDLAEDGRLTRVRECDICRRWFFAHCDSPKFRFCSDGCREKHWRSTPEGKRKRALFARKYRRKVKDGEREALK